MIIQKKKEGDIMRVIFHIDANSAYLSWTATAMLEKGYPIDIREISSVIAGDPKNRHGIILAVAKVYGNFWSGVLMGVGFLVNIYVFRT